MRILKQKVFTRAERRAYSKFIISYDSTKAGAGLMAGSMMMGRKRK